MGASQYKKQRIEEREKGPSAKEIAAQEAAQKNKKQRIIYSVVAVILVLVIALVLFVNSSAFSNGLAAVKIDGESYTVAETRFAYNTVYSEIYSAYGSYGFLDNNVPLDKQACIFDENLTWKDYILEQAVDYLEQMSVLYELAVAEGYTLTEEGQASIDATINNLSLYASLGGYTTDGYIALYYGDGNNEESLRHMLEIVQLAYDYSNAKQASLTYSEEELDNYYAENADTYNTVSYLNVILSAEADEENNVDAETAMAEARKLADTIEAACDNTVDGFRAAVEANVDANINERSNAIGNLGEKREWFTDAERAEGDVLVFEEDDRIQLYCYLGSENNEYNTVSVRHILIKAADSDSDGVYNDEEKAIALNALEEIQSQWDGSEEHFIELAKTYSQDSGSAAEGGLYENIHKGQMVEEFDAFCFSGAANGDTAVVYGESGDYAGYHLIYFVGEGQTYAQYLAENAMRSEDYIAWEDALLSDVSTEKTFMFRYV